MSSAALTAKSAKCGANLRSFPGQSASPPRQDILKPLKPYRKRENQTMKLGELAARLGCRLEGPSDIEISAVAGMDEALPSDLTFLSNPKYRPKLQTTRAAAIIVGPEVPALSRPALRSDNPYLT